MKKYKGITIEKLYPSGYYEAYILDGFYKADTLSGIKRLINEKLNN